MFFKQLYYMYYNTRHKSAPKEGHHSVLSPNAQISFPKTWSYKYCKLKHIEIEN